MIAHIGIDPGQTGAAVIIINDEFIEFVDFKDPHQVAAQMQLWDMTHNIKMVYLEKVHSMPGQGVRSVFSFGCNFGVWLGILSTLMIPFRLVTPQAWQKGLVTKSDGKDSKERSLTVARRLFPQVDWISRKKDHNRADALLMAYQAQKD